MLFAKVGEDVFEHESGSFDGVIRAWVLAHRTTLGLQAFTGVTVAGGTLPMTVLAAVTAVWLWVGHRRRVAAVIVAAAAASTAAFVAIKQVFARARPGLPALVHRASYAFPSGHSTVAAAVLSTIAYVLWRERLIRGRVAGIAPVVLFILVGLSRLYLDRHWATDVLGGWCLGLGIAAASGALYEHWRAREHPARG